MFYLLCLQKYFLLSIFRSGSLNWSLKYIKAPIVAVSILGESVGASILAYILFKELLLWYQIIGGIFVLLGLYFATANERKSVNEFESI